MTIRSLRIPVDADEPVKFVEIPETEAMTKLQSLVEGNFQVINLRLDIAAWLNEEGKLVSMPFNPRAQQMFTASHGFIDTLVGPVVLTGGTDDDGSTMGLNEDQLENIKQVLDLTVHVKIENVYSDGHESTFEYLIAPPEGDTEADIEAWWDDEVYPLTGDGHGTDSSGSCLTATVIAGPAYLVGKDYEWTD